MPKLIPPSTPELNHRRAVAALLPIIKVGLAESSLSIERAPVMTSFYELATEYER